MCPRTHSLRLTHPHLADMGRHSGRWEKRQMIVREWCLEYDHIGRVHIACVGILEIVCLFSLRMQTITTHLHCDDDVHHNDFSCNSACSFSPPPPPPPLCQVVKIPLAPNSTLVVLNEMQFDRDYCLTLTTRGTAYLLSAESEHERARCVCVSLCRCRSPCLCLCL
jgi:hypothetical protein